MKKKFYYASLAFAGIIGMSACSKEENVAVAEKQIVDELTIKIDGSAGSRAVSNGEGNENDVNDVAIYVKTGTSSEDTNPTYKKYFLGANETQLTVKYAAAGSKVYVVANADYDGEGEPDANFVFKGGADPYENVLIDSDKGFDKNIIGEVKKEYIGTLSQDGGSFLMSGSADVVGSGESNEAKTMTVQLNRDLAKVSFNLSATASGKKWEKGSAEKGADGFYRPKKGGIKGLIVKRSAQKVGQFLTDGSAGKGYALSGEGYIQDYPVIKSLGAATAEKQFNDWNSLVSGGMDANKVNTTLHDGKTEGVSATSKDFTFVYPWTKASTSDADSYQFDPFYVLPNYVETRDYSTVVVLATEVEYDATSADGDYANGDPGKVEGVRYYKARISSSANSFQTLKNQHYIIDAKLFGPGQDTVEKAIEENSKNDLVITLQVQPWGLVMSSQDIQ